MDPGVEPDGGTGGARHRVVLRAVTITVTVVTVVEAAAATDLWDDTVLLAFTERFEMIIKCSNIFAAKED